MIPVLDLTRTLLLIVANCISEKDDGRNFTTRRIAKWVKTTVALIIADLLFVFQILLVASLAHCHGKWVNRLNMALICALAAVEALIIIVGMVVWIVSSALLVKDTSSWNRNRKAPAVEGAGDPDPER
jgi:hypothetical protein